MRSWIFGASRRLESASRALLARVLAEPVVGLEQAGWPRLDGTGDTPWQMWCLTAPRAVVRRIRDDKSAETFKALMNGYSGVVVCGALKTHEAGARGNDAIALAGCWAHVFRKFEEAAPNHPEANLAMKWIGELYAIDERAGDDLVKKAELRRNESAEIIATMKSWLWNQAVLKTLPIGYAAAYVIANWDRLTRFLGDARIPLDNNATERAIRGPVVGRKNHYGSKSKRGTEIAAVFYTLLETAKLCGVDPAKRRSPTRAARCSCLAISRHERALRSVGPDHAVNTGQGGDLRSNRMLSLSPDATTFPFQSVENVWLWTRFTPRTCSRARRRISK